MLKIVERSEVSRRNEKTVESGAQVTNNFLCGELQQRKGVDWLFTEIRHTISSTDLSFK
jgi:hypothetical protein